MEFKISTQESSSRLLCREVQIARPEGFSPKVVQASSSANAVPDATKVTAPSLFISAHCDHFAPAELRDIVGEFTAGLSQLAFEACFKQCFTSEGIKRLGKELRSGLTALLETGLLQMETQHYERLFSSREGEATSRSSQIGDFVFCTKDGKYPQFESQPGAQQPKVRIFISRFETSDAQRKSASGEVGARVSAVLTGFKDMLCQLPLYIRSQKYPNQSESKAITSALSPSLRRVLHCKMMDVEARALTACSEPKPSPIDIGDRIKNAIKNRIASNPDASEVNDRVKAADLKVARNHFPHRFKIAEMIGGAELTSQDVFAFKKWVINIAGPAMIRQGIRCDEIAEEFKLGHDAKCALESRVIQLFAQSLIQKNRSPNEIIDTLGLSLDRAGALALLYEKYRHQDWQRAGWHSYLFPVLASVTSIDLVKDPEYPGDIP